MSDLSYFAVIDGLRESAARFPNAPALLGPETVTYGSLHQQACRIAARIQQAGVKPGARMAIWTLKGNDFITAIWGALEAGLAYVPLDPCQPSARAAQILREADPEVMVAHPDLLSHLPGALPDSLRLVLFADGDTTQPTPGLPVSSSRLGALPDAPHEPFSPLPDTVATVLFTSGSTGVPKGVQLSYRNLHAFVGWAVSEFDLKADDVIANHASFHFDLSTFDLFAAARVRAAVWPIPTPQQSNIAAISEGIGRYGVTTIYAVPSILTMLTRARLLGPDVAPTLRRVLFAGEVFPIFDLQALAAQLPEGCTLYNLFGPTETNVCTAHRVTEADLAGDQPVPIGKPLPGQIAHILDPETRLPVAEGAKGELVVEGSLVTPGYLNVADETIRASHRAGRHATGDIVSSRDGVLHYHGRIDRIVKMQGNRVELGEIEAAIVRHPSVRQAATIHISGPRGSDLVAFVSCEAGRSPPNAIDLLNHLRTLLPRYMLPRHFKIMSTLPLNPNGKIDMRQLTHIAEDQFLRAPEQRRMEEAEDA
ncbi:AMP-binding protein [Notoacmeibacter ruber]|uniref:D-alanine--poly(Phosphoribitol) ligase n=1 Tax=Notoacmeibacter ruber TaxID=2670375 RepID=A0A3L7J9K9_9HYPH|nr:AMP-binding protein [Notoacmeibacter ruber]RLQ85192.1 D-alanine--poly(phosphoribitol) ligase [Notoacmeibacter ruber]